jgi:hypothetical protein
MDGTGVTHGLRASDSRSNRHSWMTPDVPDLATDQKVGGLNPLTAAAAGPCDFAEALMLQSPRTRVWHP